MPHKIVYRRRTTLIADIIKVENERGAVTTFSDALAYSAFVHGIEQFRAKGVDVTLYDQDGVVIVGEVTDPKNRIVNAA
jgi:hypothetical protein